MGGRLEGFRVRNKEHGVTRLCAAHAQHVREACPRPGPTCRTSLGRRCSRPSGCGLCKERSRGSVWPPGLSMWTAEHVCGMPCVCLGVPASRELGWLRTTSSIIWYQLNMLAAAARTDPQGRHLLQGLPDKESGRTELRSHVSASCCGGTSRAPTCAGVGAVTSSACATCVTEPKFLVARAAPGVLGIRSRKEPHGHHHWL